jgi:hypothetical protein
MSDSAPILETDQRPRFPKWGAKERDFWMDLLADYSGCFLGQLGDQQEKGDTTLVHLPKEDQATEAVLLAARLADVALQEMGYRFWIQENGPKRRPRVVKRTRR